MRLILVTLCSYFLSDSLKVIAAIGHFLETCRLNISWCMRSIISSVAEDPALSLILPKVTATDYTRNLSIWFRLYAVSVHLFIIQFLLFQRSSHASAVRFLISCLMVCGWWFVKWFSLSPGLLLNVSAMASVHLSPLLVHLWYLKSQLKILAGSSNL